MSSTRSSSATGEHRWCSSRASISWRSWRCWSPRRPSGEVVTWPTFETVQVDGMCDEVVYPAPVSPELDARARRWRARRRGHRSRRCAGGRALRAGGDGRGRAPGERDRAEGAQQRSSDHRGFPDLAVRAAPPCDPGLAARADGHVRPGRGDGERGRWRGPETPAPGSRRRWQLCPRPTCTSTARPPDRGARWATSPCWATTGSGCADAPPWPPDPGGLEPPGGGGAAHGRARSRIGSCPTSRPQLNADRRSSA